MVGHVKLRGPDAMPITPPEWDNGGRTDLGNLRLLDGEDCHKHRHETGIGISRQPDGTWTVDGETFPPWPTPPPASDTEIITRWPPAAEPIDPDFQQLLQFLATTTERADPNPQHPG